MCGGLAPRVGPRGVEFRALDADTRLPGPSAFVFGGRTRRTLPPTGGSSVAPPTLERALRLHIGKLARTRLQRFNPA